MQKTKARPIIFNADEVRAALAGEKTQHRVIVENAPDTSILFNGKEWRYDGLEFKENGCCEPDSQGVHYMERLEPKEGEVHQYTEEYESVGYCPYGAIGDQLWVQEDHARQKYGTFDVFHGKAHYFADGPLSLDARHDAGLLKKYPASDMPRWASRLLLEITDIRIERLQDISHADAVAEGAHHFDIEARLRDQALSLAQIIFSRHWDAKHQDAEWESNPWVWLLEFEQVDKS